MKLTEGRPAKVSRLLFKFLAFKNTLPLATDDLLACVCHELLSIMPYHTHLVFNLFT